MLASRRQLLLLLLLLQLLQLYMRTRGMRLLLLQRPAEEATRDRAWGRSEVAAKSTATTA